MSTLLTEEQEKFLSVGYVRIHAKSLFNGYEIPSLVCVWC